MKKMIYFAAFAIMMAMGNMNAYANQFNNRNNEVRMDGRGHVEVRVNDRHHEMNRHIDHKMSRREAERRRMEERRRIEEARRMEAHRHHNLTHHHEVVVVNDNVAASVAVGAAVAAFVSALIK